MGGLAHYGIVHEDCIMIKGCCMGPKKRVIMLLVCVGWEDRLPCMYVGSGKKS